jgi:phage terminase small subunit
VGGKDDLLKQEYILAQGKISLKELAIKYNVKYATVRSRKKREEWDKGLNTRLDTVDNNTKKMQRSQKTIKHDATDATVNKKDEKILLSATDATENATVLCNTNMDATESVAALHMKLTSKQIIFCQEFCIDFNGSRAAIAAGYSRKSARSIASNLLTKDNIHAVIEEFQKCAMKSLSINQTKIIMEYASIAFSDITTYVDVGRKRSTTLDKAGNKITAMNDYCHLKNGQLINANTIQEIKINDQGTFIKMHDKHKALEFLVKVSGMVSDNARTMEIQKIKLIQEKIKAQSKDGSNDDGNIKELINSLSNIDLSLLDKKEGE